MLFAVVGPAGCRKGELHLAQGAGGPVPRLTLACFLGLSRRGKVCIGPAVLHVVNLFPSVPKSMKTAEVSMSSRFNEADTFLVHTHTHIHSTPTHQLRLTYAAAPAY